MALCGARVQHPSPAAYLLPEVSQGRLSPAFLHPTLAEPCLPEPCSLAEPRLPALRTPVEPACLDCTLAHVLLQSCTMPGWIHTGTMPWDGWPCLTMGCAAASCW